MLFPKEFKVSQNDIRAIYGLLQTTTRNIKNVIHIKIYSLICVSIWVGMHILLTLIIWLSRKFEHRQTDFCRIFVLMNKYIYSYIFVF